MNFKSYLKHGVSLLVGAMMLGSCADNSVSDLLEVVNDDAIAVMMLRPDDILKSFDASIEDGRIELPNDVKDYIEKDDIMEVNEFIAVTEGIDRTQVMIAVFEFERFWEWEGEKDTWMAQEPIIVAALRDKDVLDKSLKNAGFEESTDEGFVTYTDDSYQIVLSDDHLWLFDLSEDEGTALAAEVVKDLLADVESNPLADWKRTKIADNGDKEFVFLVPSLNDVDEDFEEALGVNIGVFTSIDVDGSKAEMKGEILKGNGEILDIENYIDMKPISTEATYLGENDMLAFACGSNNIVEFVLEKANRRLNEQEKEIFNSLTGGMFMSLNMKRSKINDFMDAENYEALVGIGCNPRKAENMINMAKENIPDVENYGNGFKYLVPGVGEFFVNHENDNIIVHSKNYEKNNRMGADDLKDYDAWAAINLNPENLGIFKQSKINSGIKARGYMKGATATITLEVTGSDYSIGHALVDMAMKLEKNF